MNDAPSVSTRALTIPDGLEVVEAHRVGLLSYHDLDGRPGFKMALHRAGDRWVLYLGHFWDRGWSVVDVTDPAAPSLLQFVSGPPNTWTLQVQAADGLLLAGLETPPDGWGHDPSRESSEGVLIFDIETDPAHPQLLGSFRTGGRGTHRNFYAGGRYAHLAANPPGFAGNILITVDLADPGEPTEVSRWWFPGQNIAEGEEPEFHHYLHGPAFVSGSLAYLGYGKAGMVILDLSDIRAPELIGHLPLEGFGSELGCHSAVPVPGRPLVLVNSEAIREDGLEPYNYCFVVDVSDPEAPFVVDAFPQPLPSPSTGLSSYFHKPGRFGPHNQHHPQGELHLRTSVLVFMTYFNAGLRVFDMSEPKTVREVGFFVPSAPSKRRGPLPEVLETQFEDVLVDSRGVIYCTDKNHGLFILETDLL